MILLENQFLYVFRLLILGLRLIKCIYSLLTYFECLVFWCRMLHFSDFLPVFAKIHCIYKCKIVPKCCEPVEMIHIFDLI